MTHSKAPWLTRGSAIALMMAAGIALAACGGGGGLNEDESATLQERLDTAEAEAAAADAARESLNNPMFAVSRGRGGLDVKLDDIADRPGAALVTGYGANRRYPRRSASFPAVPPAAGRLLPCHPVA